MNFGTRTKKKNVASMGMDAFSSLNNDSLSIRQKRKLPPISSDMFNMAPEIESPFKRPVQVIQAVQSVEERNTFFENVELKSINSKLSVQLEQLKSEFEQLRNDLERSKNETKVNSDMNRRSLDYLEKNKVRIKDLEYELKELNHQLKVATADKSNKDSSAEDPRKLRKDYMDSNTRVNELEVQLHRKETELDRVVAENRELSDRNVVLESNSPVEIDGLKNQLTKEQTKNVKLAAENSKMQSNVKIMMAQIKEFASKKSTFDNTHEGCYEKIKELESKLVTAPSFSKIEKKEDLQEALRLAQEENLKLIEKNNSVKNTLTEFISDNKEFQAKITELSSNCERLEKENERLRAEIDGISQDMDGFAENITSLAKAKSELEDECARLETENEEILERNSNLEKEAHLNRKMISDLDAMKETSEQFKKKSDEFRVIVKEQAAKLKELESEQAKSDEAHTFVCSTMIEERNKVEKLTIENQKQLASITDLESKISSLQQTLKDTTSGVKDSKVSDISTQTLEQFVENESGSKREQSDEPLTEADLEALNFKKLGEQNSRELNKWAVGLAKKIETIEKANEDLLKERNQLASNNNKLQTELKHWKSPPMHPGYAYNQPPNFTLGYFPPQHFNDFQQIPPPYFNSGRRR